MSKRDPYAIKIPVGMTDWLILFGPIDGRAFRKAVLRAVSHDPLKHSQHGRDAYSASCRGCKIRSFGRNVKRTFSGRSGLWRNT